MAFSRIDPLARAVQLAVQDTYSMRLSSTQGFSAPPQARDVYFIYQFINSIIIQVHQRLEVLARCQSVVVVEIRSGVLAFSTFVDPNNGR